jgi:hypothetical protein
MSTQATATYLHLVRHIVQGLQLKDVATHMSTAMGTTISVQDVRNIEAGEQAEPAVLAAFVNAIQADMDHVTTLLADDAPTDATIGAMIRVMRTRFNRTHGTLRNRG